MLNPNPELVNLILGIVANGASLIVILTEKKMGSIRKALLFIFLGIVVLCSLTAFNASRTASETQAAMQSTASIAVNQPFVIHDVELVKASGGNVSLRSGPSQNANRLDILYDGAMAVYKKSVLDEYGLVWHFAECSGNEGWLSSKWTVLQ